MKYAFHEFATKWVDILYPKENSVISYGSLFWIMNKNNFLNRNLFQGKHYLYVDQYKAKPKIPTKDGNNVLLRLKCKIVGNLWVIGFFTDVQQTLFSTSQGSMYKIKCKKPILVSFIRLYSQNLENAHGPYKIVNAH